RRRHRWIRNRTAEPAVPGRLELAIPPRLRQPDFDADVGVGGRRQLQRHAAECRRRFEHCRGSRVGSVRRNERASLQRLGRHPRWPRSATPPPPLRGLPPARPSPPQAGRGALPCCHWSQPAAKTEKTAEILLMSISLPAIRPVDGG